MQKGYITVPVYIDAKTFRGFALFESFIRQRRWRPLSVFAGILLASAIVCFVMAGKAEQAVLLGVVLTIVGLGLPVVYFLSFLSSVKQQCEKMCLSIRRYAYTLTFCADDEITIKTGKDEQTIKWEDIFAVYRVRQAMYLFTSQKNAYILPNGQVEGGPDHLWQMMKGKIPADRLF